jgi:hypothetical protein
MQSFTGRAQSFNHVLHKQRVSRASYVNPTWSLRQSKDAILAAKEQAKKDAIEFQRIKEARRELPHLLNRALII